MFYLISAILSISAIWVARTRGLMAAIGLCWVATVVTPSWISGPLNFNVHVWAALFALIIWCAMDGNVRLSNWRLADVIVLALAVSQVMTETLVDKLRITVVLLSVFEWLLPYVLGRIALRSTRDIPVISSAAAWMCLGLPLLAISESVLRVNLVRTVLGHNIGMSEVRWGLKRAEGTTLHPIYFGMLLVLLLPWAIQAWDLARRGVGPRWWRVLPWLSGAGIFCAMSRGAQIATALVLFIMAFCQFPAWRRRMAMGALLASMIVVVASNVFVEALHVWSNENLQEHEDVVIKGETYRYSGTNHRYLQLLVYGDAARDAGWFGYGMKRLLGLPNPIVEDVPAMFQSIDNHYLVQVLRNGHLGIGLFMLLSVASMIPLVRPALNINAPGSLLASGLLAANTAVTLMMWTVWLSPDFGFLWLFGAGLAGTLGTISDAGAPVSSAVALPEPRPAPKTRIRPQLVTGHPT